MDFHGHKYTNRVAAVHRSASSHSSRDHASSPLHDDGGGGGGRDYLSNGKGTAVRQLNKSMSAPPEALAPARSSSPSGGNDTVTPARASLPMTLAMMRLPSMQRDHHKDPSQQEPQEAHQQQTKEQPVKPPSRQYHYKRRQRYLQEDDRIMIIRRIEAGEKQSDLAKEFQVTRAAICNTFKNRHDILRRSGLVAANSIGTSASASGNGNGLANTSTNGGSRYAGFDGDGEDTEAETAQATAEEDMDEQEEDNQAKVKEEEEEQQPRTGPAQAVGASPATASVLDTPREALPITTSASHRTSNVAAARSFAIPSIAATSSSQQSSFLKRPHSEVYYPPPLRGRTRSRELEQDESDYALEPEDFGRSSQRSRATMDHQNRRGFSSPGADGDMEELEAIMVDEIRTPAMVSLMTCLRDRDISNRLFRHTADRVMRLLLEDAIGRSPMVRSVVIAPSGRPMEGLISQYETCSIGISKTSYPLMQSLQSILPNVKSGFVDILRRRHNSRWYLQVAQVSLPHRLHDQYVLLLDSTCAVGDTVVEAIQVLLRAGCSEDMICFVCVMASAEAVAFISSRFPKVKLLVAALDPEVDAHHRILPGCGDFVARYYGMDHNQRQYQ